MPAGRGRRARARLCGKALSSAPKDPFILGEDRRRGGIARPARRCRRGVPARRRYHGRFARPHLAQAHLHEARKKTRKAAREYRQVLEIEENPEARQALDAISEQASDSYPVTASTGA
ncbi:MAG: hypothetical protein U0166_03215 [Acidobacteriota bacterium]